MNEREYQRLKAQIEAERNQKLEALEIVWAMASTNGTSDNDRAPRRRRNGALNNAIKALLPTLEGVFSQPKVLELVTAKHPELEATPASVSSVLRRFEEDGLIGLVERGAGQRASTYVVPKAEPTALSLDEE